jgi:predicted nucleotidyltransferase
MGRARTSLFALNRGHPLTEALVALFEAERHQWESLSRQLRGVLAKFDTVKAAWLYGSTARGEDRAGSDVDIAIAVEGDVEQTADAVRAAMHPIEDRYGTAISVVALAPGDILARVNDPWWSDVVRDARTLKAIAPQRYVAQLERAGAPR